MKSFIIYVLIGTLILIFIVVAIHRNKGYNDNWKNRIIFEGIIQEVVHIKNKKGSFFKINDKWYNISYNLDFEEQNLIGFKIEKRINEEGIWLEKEKGSDSLLFYWARGNVIKDSVTLNTINQKSKAIN